MGYLTERPERPETLPAAPLVSAGAPSPPSDEPAVRIWVTFPKRGAVADSVEVQWRESPPVSDLVMVLSWVLKGDVHVES